MSELVALVFATVFDLILGWRIALGMVEKPVPNIVPNVVSPISPVPNPER